MNLPPAPERETRNHTESWWRTPVYAAIAGLALAAEAKCQDILVEKPALASSAKGADSGTSAATPEAPFPAPIDYAMWPSDRSIKHFPSATEVKTMATLCRRACVLVESHATYPLTEQSHRGGKCGFVLSLDPAMLTEQGQRKRFVATCRHTMSDTAPAVHIAVDYDRREHLARQALQGANRDVLILVFDEGQLGDAPGLPIAPWKATSLKPVLLFQTARQGDRYWFNPMTGSSVREDSGEPSEQVLLTHTVGTERHIDSNYPEQRGFLTRAGLFSGGSGSPAIVWENGKPFVAGLQTLSVKNKGVRSTLSGEMPSNGYVVGSADIIDTLRRYGMIKRESFQP